ncbi:MAG: nucleotidyl transferase AbiEii/AbiGii toxin family protein [Burkholderiaceae bacterium]
MADSWFTLSRADQAEALEVAAGRTGRPPHLLEKDIWVVWTLSAIYESSLAEKLTFKGGTSLSKVYKIIDRFSEDIDLTYDIREVVPDLLRDGNPIPASASQAKKITDRVRDRLPRWIEHEVRPILLSALQRDGLEANLSLASDEKEKLILLYEPIKFGTGYAASTIQLEFGARATGEPHQRHAIACDMAPAIHGIEFPTARPLVMAAERTFWEKATAAHVYCRQGRLRSERYSRHWYDLAAMANSGHAQAAIDDLALARSVAKHKSMFFAEKDAERNPIDYEAAVGTEIQLILEGGALNVLEKDYTAMLEDGLLATHLPSFADIISTCAELESLINR